MKKLLFSNVALATIFALCSAAYADLLIGIGAPFTGPYAAFGTQIQKGVEAAVVEINDAGGLNGEKIKIVLGDDGFERLKAQSVARKFVTDGVTFVIGHYNSDSSIPASKIYAKNGIVMMTPASTHPLLTEQKQQTTFRLIGRDDKQGKVAGEYIAEHFRDAKIAILDDRTGYGKGLASGTKRALGAKGVKEIFNGNIDPNERDFSKLIAKLKKMNITLVYWGGLYTQAGLFIHQMADQNLKATFFTGDGIVSNKLSSIAGDTIAGTLFTFSPQPGNDPANRQLTEKFRAIGIEPIEYAFNSYAAVQSIAAAAKAAKSNNPKTVAEAMKRQGPFKTVLGDISFDEKGDYSLPGYTIYEWRKSPNGQYYYYQK